MIEHGGALDRAMAEFGGSRDDWLDLSTGINAAPYPVPPVSADAWNRLPDARAEAKLLAAARGYYGISGRSGLVAAPGTQALIQLYPHLAAPGSAMVIGPTYEEHVQALGLAGRSVRYDTSLTRIDDEDRIVVLVNPNNPDGAVFSKDAILSAADIMAERGGFLVVDEAFADTDPKISVAAEAGMAGLVVLKSFGKFFGLAGVRLGFLAGPTDVAEAVQSMQGPWAVSGPALEIGAQALADSGWVSATRKRLKKERNTLEAGLKQSGLQLVGGTDLFVLARHFQAKHIWRELANRHILVRRFDYQHDWLRFGIPTGTESQLRLTAVLAEIMAAL